MIKRSVKTVQLRWLRARDAHRARMRKAWPQKPMDPGLQAMCEREMLKAMQPTMFESLAKCYVEGAAVTFIRPPTFEVDRD